MTKVYQVALAAVAVALSFPIGATLALENSSGSTGVEADALPRYTVSPPQDFADFRLTAAGTVIGQSSVAVNPRNANVFVATYATGGSCWVRVSTNAGRTWAAAKKLPAPGKPNCDTPAVTWAPDGSRVYAAYSYRVTYTDPWGEVLTKEAGVLVSSSTDQGLSWSSPTIVETYIDVYDIVSSLKLSTPLGVSDARSVYLLIGLFIYDDDYYFFSRSSNRGVEWSAPIRMISTSNWEGVTSPSIAGGKGGQLMIAYGYRNCWDGPCVDTIEHNRSGDYGEHFQWHTVSVPDVYGNTAVGFGAGGAAHIVYAVNSWGGTPGTYYTYSTKAPYTAWSGPFALSDGLSANSFYSPALAVSACGSGTSVLHAVWLDDRAGTDKYNVHYRRKVAKTGEPWSPTMRVSGTSPVTNFDYPLFVPTIAAGAGTAVGVWGQDWDFYGPRPVWSSRIAPGVSCP